MKKVLIVLLFLINSVYFAQPVIDGVSTGDTDYLSLATWTQVSTGFGDFGVVELDAFSDNANLYILVKGVCENNFNEFYVFIHDVSSASSLASGTQLPAGSDSGSPFFGFKPTLDFDVDFGLRLTGGNSNNAFVSIVDYRSSGNTDTFLGTIADNGTLTAVTSGTYIGTALAYKFATNLTTYSGIEGWEMSIPLNSLGITQGDNIELFALYGNDDFISANTLPEIAGQSGNNLGSNPDFTGIAGNQHTTAAPLPVELTSFTALASGKNVELNWATATEVNNYGFQIERASNLRGQKTQNGNNDLEGYQTLGFVQGHGNSNSPRNYSFTDKNVAFGKYSYRLKQIDTDGKFEYSDVVEVKAGEIPNGFTLKQNYPNPFNPATNIVFAVDKTSPVKLTVYNMLGSKVTELFNGQAEGGQVYNIAFDASKLSGGVYFYKLTSVSNTITKKMILLK